MTSLHADEAFLDHYQLSHDPFAPRVPGFKFFPAQRKPVLAQLHHLARYSHLMLVVTGPLGSGKTLLRQALAASTNKQSVQSVVVSARSAGDAASILGQIAQYLDVAEPQVQSILSKMVQLALTGQEVYLLVDDAEQLDESALQALLELAAGVPEGRPHVFLFGEPSLIAGLDELNIEEERFHIIELAPYSEEETREYLEQRLVGAGRGIEVFSREQIADIHENADGWPGTINQVARDTLIEAMIASRSTAKRPAMGFKMPKKHVLALSAVVVVAVAAAVLMPRKGDKAPEDAPAAQAQLPLGDGNSSAAIEFSGSSQPKPLPLGGQSQPVMREPLAQAAGMGEGEEGSPAGDTALQPGNPPPTVTTIAPPPTQVAVAKPAPKVAEKAAEKPASGGSGNSSWYTGQKPGNYVVQILGTSSEASAQAFVKAQGGDYRYFRKSLQGKPLYVVTYGNFANRDAAVAAIKNLPAKVQAGKPWPRTVASVQQELASAR